MGTYGTEWGCLGWKGSAENKSSNTVKREGEKLVEFRKTLVCSRSVGAETNVAHVARVFRVRPVPTPLPVPLRQK